jgi:hypothetical protein
MAVRLCKLAPDEAQRAFPRRGQQDLSDSMAALGELQPGAAAAIERAGLSDRAIKRRLGSAAKQLGYRPTWARQHPRGAVLPGRRGTSRQATNGRPPRRAAPPSPVPAAAPAPEPTAARSRRGRRRQTAERQRGCLLVGSAGICPVHRQAMDRALHRVGPPSASASAAHNVSAAVALSGQCFTRPLDSGGRAPAGWHSTGCTGDGWSASSRPDAHRR